MKPIAHPDQALSETLGARVQVHSPERYGWFSKRWVPREQPTEAGSYRPLLVQILEDCPGEGVLGSAEAELQSLFVPGGDVQSIVEDAVQALVHLRRDV